MTAVAFGPTSCPSGLVLKSELLHSPEAQSGFVPKHSHHEWKNPASLKNNSFQYVAVIDGVGAAGFLGFSFFKCEIPQGLMVGLQDFYRGACSPGESMQTQHQRRQSHTWRKGF